MFAKSIDSFTFQQTFLHEHLPTIVALIFSIYWSWIDIQVKRLEPYFQLSKEGGSTGDESMLLSNGVLRVSYVVSGCEGTFLTWNTYKGRR